MTLGDGELWSFLSTHIKPIVAGTGHNDVSTRGRSNRQTHFEIVPIKQLFRVTEILYLGWKLWPYFQVFLNDFSPCKSVLYFLVLFPPRPMPVLKWLKSLKRSKTCFDWVLIQSWAFPRPVARKFCPIVTRHISTRYPRITPPKCTIIKFNRKFKKSFFQVFICLTVF